MPNHVPVWKTNPPLVLAAKHNWNTKMDKYPKLTGTQGQSSARTVTALANAPAWTCHSLCPCYLHDRRHWHPMGARNLKGGGHWCTPNAHILQVCTLQTYFRVTTPEADFKPDLKYADGYQSVACQPRTASRPPMYVPCSPFRQ